MFAAQNGPARTERPIITPAASTPTGESFRRVSYTDTVGVYHRPSRGSAGPSRCKECGVPVGSLHLAVEQNAHT